MLSITVSSMVEPFELTTLQSNVHEAAVVAAVTEVVLGAAVVVVAGKQHLTFESSLK